MIRKTISAAGLFVAACVVSPVALSQQFLAPPKAAQQPPASSALNGRTTMERIRETNVIRVGHRRDALPFAYVIPGNPTPIGYGIDMCNEVVNLIRREAKLPNLRVEYVTITAGDRYQQLAAGRIDIECGQTVNAPERRKQATFAMPYFFTGQQLLVPANSPIRDFFDLNDRVVAVPKGTNAIMVVNKWLERGVLKNVKMVEAPDNETAFEMLQRGEAHAMMQIGNLLHAYRAAYKDPNAYKVVGRHPFIEPVGIIMRPGDAEMKKLVDKALAGLMLDGLATRMYRKWFLSPVPPNGIVVDIPMTPVLRDQFMWPTDRTGDEA